MWEVLVAYFSKKVATYCGTVMSEKIGISNFVIENFNCTSIHNSSKNETLDIHNGKVRDENEAVRMQTRNTKIQLENKSNN